MVNENVSRYLAEMNNLRCALKSLQDKFDCLRSEHCALEESYNTLKKELEVANDDYKDVNKRRRQAIKEKEIAMKYIEKLLVENERIGEIVKFCLYYKRGY